MIHLKVVTPFGIGIDEDVVSVTLPFEKGPTMIEGGCTPNMGGREEPGIMKVTKERKTSFYVLFPFTVSIGPKEVVVVSERLESGSSIDVARANEDLARNKGILETSQEEKEIKKAKARINKAILRIKAKDLSSGNQS